MLYDDDDIVVVDKPVGVAAHPSPGWTGPTVVGGLAAMGYRIATSGAAERQGIVHRLDAGTTGVMVVAKSERAYSALKRAFKERTVDKRYSRAGAGPSRPDQRHHRRARSTGIPAPTTSSRSSPAAGRASPTTRRSRRSGPPRLLDIHLETGRTHQIRVHMAALRHPCVGDLTYGADPVLARAARPDPAVAARPRTGLRAPGAPGSGSRSPRRIPADLQHALDARG